MLTLLSTFDLATYSPRCYIVAATDKMSGQKATALETKAGIATRDPSTGPISNTTSSKSVLNRRLKFEKELSNSDLSPFSTISIPRSREVGQSFRSSIWTTLRAALYAAYAVLSFSPDLVLTNGPGTALPVVVAVVAGRLLGLAGTKVVYVESIARVKKLSLTGKILYHLRLADEFLVQWEELVVAHPRAIYAGRLM